MTTRLIRLALPLVIVAIIGKAAWYCSPEATWKSGLLVLCFVAVSLAIVHRLMK